VKVDGVGGQKSIKAVRVCDLEEVKLLKKTVFGDFRREISRRRSVRGYLRNLGTAPRRASDRPSSCISFSRLSLSPRPFLNRYTGVLNALALYMWRSNVLRLRNCSSTTTFRNGLNTRWYSSKKSLPVSEREFEHALREVLPWEWRTESKTPLGTDDFLQCGMRD